MKKMFLTLLGASLLWTGWADNLLKNGNFEKGLNEWIVPSWIKNSITPEKDTAVNAGGGTASLKLQGEKGKRGIVFARFLIPEKTRYLKIRMMVKTKNLGKTYAGAFLEIQNVKKSPWSISTYKRSANRQETEWLEYSETVELPENAGTMGKLYLHMAADAEGTVWFDDITLEPLDVKKK